MPIHFNFLHVKAADMIIGRKTSNQCEMNFFKIFNKTVTFSVKPVKWRNVLQENCWAEFSNFHSFPLKVTMDAFIKLEKHFWHMRRCA